MNANEMANELKDAYYDLRYQGAKKKPIKKIDIITLLENLEE